MADDIPELFRDKETMLVQAQWPCSSVLFLSQRLRRFLRKFSVPVSLKASQCHGWNSTTLIGRRRNERVVVSAADAGTLNLNFQKKRKIVEHICLLKAKEHVTEEEEKEILDYMYTTQYQLGGIVAISLGRITTQNPERYTHAVYMRFQTKDHLMNFYNNPLYLGVLEEHVLPHCHGLINVDYESEVEDEIHSIFRKGEEFNYGLEFVLLISFIGNASGGIADHALTSLTLLIANFPSLIVQSTHGSNFNLSSKHYNHGVVIRFRSVEAFEIFTGSKEYKDMWNSKFEHIIQKALYVDFSVDPMGTEIM